MLSVEKFLPKEGFNGGGRCHYYRRDDRRWDAGPRYQGDIGIKNGKIAAIGRLRSSDATKGEEVAKREHKHVIDAMLDLTLADDLQTEWLGPIVNNNAQYHKEMLSSPAAIPGVSGRGTARRAPTTMRYFSARV